jgi:hypothetical protein
MESALFAWDKAFFVFINRDLGNAIFDFICPIIRKKKHGFRFTYLLPFSLTKSMENKH